MLPNRSPRPQSARAGHPAATRPRRAALSAILFAGLLASGVGALIISSGPKIVAAPTSAAQATAAPPAARAIAERRDGGYEVLTLPPPAHSVALSRTPAGAGAARALHLAVVLVTFDDVPVEPFSSESVAELMFGPTDSLASLYEEQSFGLTRVGGDVFGWFSVARDPSSCDFVAWADAATAAVGADTLSAYTHLLVVFPETLTCEWSGLAYVGGTTAWINGQPTVRAAAHELGHNLGLGHASSLACDAPSGPVGLGHTCTKADEYGDPFTLMGSGGTLHFNAVHKRQLGWLAPRNIVEVDRSGTFELAPLGGPSDGPQILTVRRGDATVVVEYRQPVAAFERFGGRFEPAGGVTARLAEGPASAPRSLLVDATPQTRSHVDAAIETGSSLVDLSTGLRITTRSTTPESAEVEVVLAGGADAARATRPAAPTTVVAVATPGVRRSRVDLSWLPGARSKTDRPQRYLVYRDGRVVARPRHPRLTRFERHGRHVYQVVAVGSDGTRSARSPRLVVRIQPPRLTTRSRAPLRGVEARPMPDGRLMLGTRGSSGATARLPHLDVSTALPQRGRLALQLSATRTRVVVRPSRRPAARAVQIIAVRSAPQAG